MKIERQKQEVVVTAEWPVWLWFINNKCKKV